MPRKTKPTHVDPAREQQRLTEEAYRTRRAAHKARSDYGIQYSRRRNGGKALKAVFNAEDAAKSASNRLAEFRKAQNATS